MHVPQSLSVVVWSQLPMHEVLLSLLSLENNSSLKEVFKHAFKSNPPFPFWTVRILKIDQFPQTMPEKII